MVRQKLMDELRAAASSSDCTEAAPRLTHAGIIKGAQHIDTLRASSAPGPPADTLAFAAFVMRARGSMVCMRGPWGEWGPCTPPHAAPLLARLRQGMPSG